MLGYSVFLGRHYLFLEAHSFPRASLSENFSVLGTDNVRGQISEHIFAPNEGFRLYTIPYHNKLYHTMWYGQCYAMLCYAMLCYAMLCYAMLCYAMLCYAMLCYAMLCYAVLCYAMLCYAMLCYAMLCYAMLCYAMLRGINDALGHLSLFHSPFFAVLNCSAHKYKQIN